MTKKFWVEVLSLAGWMAVLMAIFVAIFVARGGFHGSGGTAFAIATAPIGLLHFLGLGDGMFAGALSAVLEVGYLLLLVMSLRTL